jgi:hypothetical protein
VPTATAPRSDAAVPLVSGPAQKKARRGLRGWQWALLTVSSVTVLVFAGRAPVARALTRSNLAAIPGWHADFSDAQVSFLPLSYSVTGLRFLPDDVTRPILLVEKLDTGVVWRDLLRGEVNAWGSLQHPSLTTFTTDSAAPDVSALLRTVMPLPMRRVQLKGGMLLAVLSSGRSDDPARPEGNAATLRFKDIEGTLETSGGPEAIQQTLALRSMLGASGTASAFVTAEVRDSKVRSLKGQLELQDLNLAELDPLLAAAGLEAGGTFSALTQVSVVRGKVTGTLEPTLENGSVKGLGPQTHAKLDALLGTDGLEVGEARSGTGLQGRFKNPTPDLWTAVSSLGRDAFVEGLSASLQKLPAHAR